MILTKKRLTTSLACLAACAIGVGLSLLPNDTQAFLASADDGGATTYSSDTLLMHDEVGYSADGITFKITVPDTYMESLQAGRQSRSGYNVEWDYNWSQYYETVILITRAESIDGYEAVSPSEQVAHSGFSLYEEPYSSNGIVGGTGIAPITNVSANTDLFNFQTESYFFVYEADKGYHFGGLVTSGIEMPEFDENNTAHFTIPHAEDENKEYYYYAQIVEVYREHRTRWFWTHDAYGALLVENIPFEGGDVFYGTELLFAPDLARQKLEDESVELTKEERQRLQKYIGVPSYGEQIAATVHYKTLADEDDPASVVDRSQTVYLPAEYAQRKSEAIGQFYLKGDLVGTWGSGS